MWFSCNFLYTMIIGPVVFSLIANVVVTERPFREPYTTIDTIVRCSHLVCLL